MFFQIEQVLILKIKLLFTMVVLVRKSSQVAGDSNYHVFYCEYNILLTLL